MRLHRLKRLDDNVLNSIQNCCKVDAYALKVGFQLRQIPFARVLVVVRRLVLRRIVTQVFDIIVVLFVDRVICQVDEALVRRLLTCCILLCGKAD